MAVKDVRAYYATMLNQYMEMKNDLADFEEAFKNGHITEDQLDAVKEDTALVEQNYQRLVYIMYLLELPNNNKKKTRVRAHNKRLEEHLDKTSVEYITSENKSALDHLRDELKRLTKQEN